MWVKTLAINNIKSFASSGNINLSKNINVLLGANNAGKSTIIKALYLLQQNTFGVTDIRIGQNHVGGHITLVEVDHPTYGPNAATLGSLTMQIVGDRTNNNPPRLELTTSRANVTSTGQAPQTPSAEPQNFIYPYLSKRKVTTYSEDVRIEREREINETLSNLVAKINRLANKNYPRHEEFEKACNDVLGLPITAFSSQNGMQTGLIIDTFENLPIGTMGEGVPNILGLIVNLCIARNKLFLIEEPENDIHPRALKALLQLIAEKAAYNQFVISTHSNIVTRYLGTFPDSKIHEITIDPYTQENRIPTSHYKELTTPEERIAALETLGYEFIDAEIWDGWLLLEESSAEKIIQEFLIPMFAQKLHGRVRTVSTKGVDRAKARFEAMNDLFVFAHLTPRYINRAWVIVDGDERGQKVIQDLKDTYATEAGKWNESHFINLRETDFEKYYPARFRTEVDRILSLSHNDKPKEKKALLKTVLDFIEEDRATAKEEFSQSAYEVIEILRAVEASLFSPQYEWSH